MPLTLKDILRRIAEIDHFDTTDSEDAHVKEATLIMDVLKEINFELALCQHTELYEVKLLLNKLLTHLFKVEKEGRERWYG